MAADSNERQRTSVDHGQQFRAKKRKHMRQIAFPDTEEIQGFMSSIDDAEACSSQAGPTEQFCTRP
jgi:hypothetical protein